MVDAHPGSVLARKLNTFLALSPDELNCVADMQSAPLKVKRGKQLTQEGQTGHKVFVLQAGWACSYKDLSGGSRQIISFPIAGDCVGLRSVLLSPGDAKTKETVQGIEEALATLRGLLTPSIGLRDSAE